MHVYVIPSSNDNKSVLLCENNSIILKSIVCVVINVLIKK